MTNGSPGKKPKEKVQVAIYLRTKVKRALDIASAEAGRTNSEVVESALVKLKAIRDKLE